VGKKERRRRTNDRIKIYVACPIAQGGHKTEVVVAAVLR